MDDPEDKKPDGWVEEKRIVDAKAKKPDDWDDEEDGDSEPRVYGRLSHAVWDKQEGIDHNPWEWRLRAAFMIITRLNISNRAGVKCFSHFFTVYNFIQAQQ